jgi:predicted N-acyltransferase
MARRGRRYIGGALNIIGGDCLYGRYWGAVEHHPCLHFEVCYYQAIDYAIEKGLARVEAGAQGEHKLARGYMPTTTYSAHWFRDRALGRRCALSCGGAARHCRHRRGPRRACPLPQGRRRGVQGRQRRRGRKAAMTIRRAA